MTERVAVWLVLAGLLLIASGCARPIDAAVLSSNAAAESLRLTHDQLAARYAADQEAAARRVQGDREDPSVRAEQLDRVRLVRARYAPVWEAYEGARAGWVVLVAAIEVAQQLVAAGGKPSIAELFELVAGVAALQRALIVAVDKVGLSPPGSPPRALEASP